MTSYKNFAVARTGPELTADYRVRIELSTTTVEFNVTFEELDAISGEIDNQLNLVVEAALLVNDC